MPTDVPPAVPLGIDKALLQRRQRRDYTRGLDVGSRLVQSANTASQEANRRPTALSRAEGEVYDRDAL